ncbi:MAG: sugar phosphate isomerase/epimerase [Chloroflexi bacterium]|nr:sugar phosphate isomerase/epimerase [Chloroflexota bacterium]
MNKISLNCSSFVAKQNGYPRPHDSWETCVRAVNEFYRPLETFAKRFEQLILDVKALGFDALDVWTPGQLSWRWASEEHIVIARRLLEQHYMAATSIGGEFGATREDFVAACKLASGVKTQLLSGTTTLLFSERAFVIATLKEYDLRLAFENHPEKTPQEMLDKIGGGGEGRIGTAVDTGWYATQGYDAVKAIEALSNHIFHVHLKDVQAPGEHINCGYCQGCAPLEASVQALKKIGYSGDYSVENHAFDHDPTEELRTALPMLRRWLASPL